MQHSQIKILLTLGIRLLEKSCLFVVSLLDRYCIKYFEQMLHKMTKLVSGIDMTVGKCLSAMEEQEKEVEGKT